MTVSELIEILKNMPPDSLVVTEGYEDGYDGIKSVSEIVLVETANKAWYYGKYEKPFPDNGEGFTAVLLYAGTKEEKD